MPNGSDGVFFEIGEENISEYQECLRANMYPSMVEAICQYIRNRNQERSEEVNRYLRDAIRNAFANSFELVSKEPEEMETENSEELDRFLNTFALKEVC